MTLDYRWKPGQKNRTKLRWANLQSQRQYFMNWKPGGSRTLQEKFHTVQHQHLQPASWNSGHPEVWGLSKTSLRNTTHLEPHLKGKPKRLELKDYLGWGRILRVRQGAMKLESDWINLCSVQTLSVHVPLSFPCVTSVELTKQLSRPAWHCCSSLSLCGGFGWLVFLLILSVSFASPGSGVSWKKGLLYSL